MSQFDYDLISDFPHHPAQVLLTYIAFGYALSVHINMNFNVSVSEYNYGYQEVPNNEENLMKEYLFTYAEETTARVTCIMIHRN